MRNEVIPTEPVSRKRLRQNQPQTAANVTDISVSESAIAPHLDAQFGYDLDIAEMTALNATSYPNSNHNMGHLPEPLDPGFGTILPTAVNSGGITTSNDAWFNVPMHFE
jgi:hypothetical protein